MIDISTELLQQYGVGATILFFLGIATAIFISSASHWVRSQANTQNSEAEENTAITNMLTSFQNELSQQRKTLDSVVREAHERELEYQKQIFELRTTITKLKTAMRYLKRLVEEKQNQITLLKDRAIDDKSA